MPLSGQDIIAHAEKDKGVHEASTAGHLGLNPRIKEMLVTIGHPEVDNDEESWCAVAHGAWMAELGIPIPPPEVNRMGRSYETWGTKLVRPQVGCTCVSTYTKAGTRDWKRHVGIVVEIDDANERVRLIGGNQSDAVTDTLWKRMATVTAYRWHVEPTAAGLRAAGSTEMIRANTLKNTGLIGGTGSVALATAQGALGGASVPAPVVDAANALPAAVAHPGAIPGPILDPSLAATPPGASLLDQLTSAGTYIHAAKELGHGAQEVGAMALAHWWLAPGVFIGGMLWWVATHMEADRIKRALAGMPLSKEL